MIASHPTRVAEPRSVAHNSVAKLRGRVGERRASRGPGVRAWPPGTNPGGPRVIYGREDGSPSHVAPG